MASTPKRRLKDGSVALVALSLSACVAPTLSNDGVTQLEALASQLQPSPTPSSSPRPPPSPSPRPTLAPPTPVSAPKLTARPLGAVAGSPFGYMEYLPKGYAEAPNDSLPLYVHLHGIGERIGGESGTANVPLENVAGFGPYASYAKSRPDFDGVILMPQAKKLSLWGAADVAAFIELALANYPKADPRRVYLFGLSLGGFGVNSCMGLAECARKVAVAVSICPGAALTYTGAVNLVANATPYWGVHAEDDSVVTIGTRTDPGIVNLAQVQGGRGATNRPDLPNHPNWRPNDVPPKREYYSKTGCWDPDSRSFVWGDGQYPSHPNPRIDGDQCFTSYSNGGHAIWTRVYSDPQLYTWAAAKRR